MAGEWCDGGVHQMSGEVGPGRFLCGETVDSVETCATLLNLRAFQNVLKFLAMRLKVPGPLRHHQFSPLCH